MSDEEYPCDPGYCQILELHEHIKALTAENKRLGQQCEGLMQAGMNNGQALIIAEAKLATCEKYRDAYDKMGRIGTEAYRDLEAKLAKAVELLKEARQDLEAYVTHDWPKDVHPHYDKKWERDMELCRRIDATLAEIKGDSHD